MTIFTFAPYELFSVAKGLSTTNYTLMFDNHLISYYDIKVVLYTLLAINTNIAQTLCKFKQILIYVRGIIDLTSHPFVIQSTQSHAFLAGLLV